MESSNKVRRIPFGSIVQHTLEFHSPELHTAFLEYERIHAGIYYDFVKRPKWAKLLLGVKEVCSLTSPTGQPVANTK